MEDTKDTQLGLRQKLALSLLGIDGEGKVDPDVFSALGVGQQMNEIEQLRGQLAEFSSKFEALENTLTNEREASKSTIEDLTSRLTHTEYARGMAVWIDAVRTDFNHLPGEPQATAEHLFWLETVDQTEEKTHFNFFKDLLAKADEQFESQFSEIGVQKNAPTDLEGKVSEYIKEHPESSYTEALEAVIEGNPGLYESYSAKVVEGK